MLAWGDQKCPGMTQMLLFAASQRVNSTRWKCWRAWGGVTQAADEVLIARAAWKERLRQLQRDLVMTNLGKQASCLIVCEGEASRLVVTGQITRR